MTPNPEHADPERVVAIFHQALEKNATERADYLLAACGNDQNLLREVQSLLAAHSEVDDSFLETSEDDDLTGRRLGGFVLQELLGSGGMGVVYDALQDHPNRRVALKVLRALPGLEQDLRRLQIEAEIMGGLTHPNIAQVFEAGTLDEPAGAVAWFAMELVADARNIVRYARDEQLDLATRLQLFDDLCRAVQYGHSRGVLHRDLKPDNVLVEPSGRLKVIDFGVARALGRDEKATLLTRAGDVVGTLTYMSPEQCDGEQLDIRTDVYSLGLILYELVTAARPFDLRGLTVTKALERRRLEDPVAPSKHRPELRGDLETILETACARDRERRYATVAALAEDLRRFRTHEPINARAPGTIHALSLWARRHRVLLFVTLLVATILIAATIVSMSFGLSASDASKREAAARIDSERKAYVANLAAASAALRNSNGGATRAYLDQVPEKLRGWEWRHLRQRADTSERTMVWNKVRVHYGAAAGHLVAATAGGPASARVWDGATGQVVLTIPRKRPVLATSCALSPDGRRLVLGYATGRVEIRELPSGRQTFGGLPAAIAPQKKNTTKDRIRHRVWAITFSATGTRFATGSTDGTVRIYRLADGQILRTWHAHAGGTFSLAFTPDGKRLITGGSTDRSIRIFDLVDGKQLAHTVAHAGNVESLAISPDGSTLISGSMDRTVKVWNAMNLQNLATLRNHTKAVKSVAFAPDGKTFASASLDTTVRIWRADDYTEQTRLIGHSVGLRFVGYSQNGERLLSISLHAVRVWNPRLPPAVPEFSGLDRLVGDLAFLPHNELAATTPFGALARWNTATGQRVSSVALQARRNRPLHSRDTAQFTSSGDQCVVALESGDTVVVRTTDGKKLRDIGRTDPSPYAVALTPSNSHVIVGGHQIRIWPLQGPAGSHKPTHNWKAENTVVALAPHPVQAHPQGIRFATVSTKSTVQVWTLAGKLLATWRDPQRAGCTIAYSPSGDRLALGRTNGTIAILSSPGLELLARLEGHLDKVTDVAFSPDGKRLASASNDGTVRLWEPEWQMQLLVLRGHSIYVSRVGWSADGQHLASGGGDNTPDACTVRVWSARD